jgi:hypothetical protein
MSRSRSVAFSVNTETAPPVPAGTMAALAVVVPVGAFKVDEPGCFCPVGNNTRKLRFAPLGGIAVAFKE